LKGYLYRAHEICSNQESLKSEIKFLQDMFIENGYDKKDIEKIIKSFEKNKSKDQNKPDYSYNTSYPWVPKISQAIKKLYKQLDLNCTFKSSSNLQNILCRRNKSSLPTNSNPGVYKIDCDCGGTYIGETGANVRTRIDQHQKSVFNGSWKDSGLAEHAKNCHQQIRWNDIKTLTVKPNYYERTIREALEIRLRKTGPENVNGLNKDHGKYVTTNTWEPLFEHLRNL